MADRFAEVAAVADAVLHEGYLLYPYRASAQKNRVRWQWGVLMPQGYGTESGEASANRTECLVELRGELHVRVRWLHLERRTGRGEPYDEGTPGQADATFTRSQLLAGAEFGIVVDAAERVDGDVTRTRWPLTARVAVRAEELPGPYDVLKLRIDVRNTAIAAPGASRDEALRAALIGTHVLLAADPGAFVSPTDPPEWARGFVAQCRSEHLWPALAGTEGRSDLLLSAPIILADHAAIAPESGIELFDGTENDELLTLRTMVLTDAEKAEARATDPRAAAIVDAVDALPPEYLERLHGAIRTLRAVAPAAGEAPPYPARAGYDDPGAAPAGATPWWDQDADASADPATDSALVGGVPVARGSAVVLRPRPSADAQDAFLAGLRATVQAVVHDVDGGTHVAVSIDGDPAAELQLAHGRFRYFRPEELEPAAEEPRRARRHRDQQGDPTTPRSSSSPVRVLVAGVGNILRSDDGFGVEVVHRLLARGGLPAGVEVEDVGIRGVHLAHRLLDGYAGLLLVDAVQRGSPPGTLHRIEHDLIDGAPGMLDAHDMRPDVVLGLLHDLAAATGVERSVGRVLVLGCEPADLEDGIGLSPPVAAAVEPALVAADELVALLLESAVPGGSLP
ncbi:hydrogenase maturation protease [Pseudonocardia thermophila]|uniref:Hydrogenase maturation protease n=1 Tax=Pseudonocardia thermophila TaxID=1848 RepID=A0A1M6PZT4_PSETH|nr:hydrogenase maturation protease [Pseudonocardia thermophila]SHK13474.1 hydrogenase maturation protease [Pseudonocardia thermophila]